MSGYLRLHLDLPPGRYPLRLDLVEVKAAGGECLLCGKEVDPPADLKAAFQDFRIPYLLLPPARMNMTSGWAFAVEERGPDRGPRIHWLAPALVIDEASRTAVRAAEFLFEVETSAAQTVSGKVAAPGEGEDDPHRTYLLSAAAAAEGPAGNGGSSKAPPHEAPLNVVSQTLTRPDGSFTHLRRRSNLLTISEQFPSTSWRRRADLSKRAPAAPAAAARNRLRAVKPGIIFGKVLDSRSGATLSGALLSVARHGRSGGRSPIEGFAGEAYSDAAGSFTFDLPAGKYILSAVARHDGVQYKSKSLNIEIFADEEQHLLLPLDAAAVVGGRIKYGAAAASS